MHKFILMYLLLLGCHALHSEWNPEYCFDDLTSVPLNDLKEPRFQQLKINVAKSLKNSWCSEEKINLLMDLMVLIKPKVCVEIGAFTGSSVLPVAAALKYLGKGTIFAIDAWSTETAVRNLENTDPNKDWWLKVDMKEVLSSFQRRITTWSLKSFCIPIRSPSNQALDSLTGSIDFLHLDGDYSEIGSTEDVQLYLPKVRSGGYVLLSNFYTMVNNKQPKLKSFCLLFDSCEIVAQIENNNSVLFKKL